jgi:hypothetical protein
VNVSARLEERNIGPLRYRARRGMEPGAYVVRRANLAPGGEWGAQDRRPPRRVRPVQRHSPHLNRGSDGRLMGRAKSFRISIDKEFDREDP